MTVRGLPAPPRSRAAVGLLLALLVQAAWLLLFQRERPAGPLGPPEKKPALLTLRLIEPAATPPSRDPARQRAPLRTSSSLAAPRSLAPAAPLPQPPVNDAPGPTVTVGTAPAPLNLALPPAHRASGALAAESLLGRMLNDPRSRSARRSVEGVVADAAGTLPVTRQSSTDGTQSTLIRKGSKCIRVSEARIRTLNPMDESTKGAASVAGPCVSG